MNPFAFFTRRGRDHRTASSLLELDDRMLRDIGLTRADVMSLRAGKSISRRSEQ